MYAIAGITFLDYQLPQPRSHPRILSLSSLREKTFQAADPRMVRMAMLCQVRASPTRVLSKGNTVSEEMIQIAIYTKQWLIEGSNSKVRVCVSSQIKQKIGYYTLFLDPTYRGVADRSATFCGVSAPTSCFILIPGTNNFLLISHLSSRLLSQEYRERTAI